MFTKLQYGVCCYGDGGSGGAGGDHWCYGGEVERVALGLHVLVVLDGQVEPVVEAGHLAQESVVQLNT